VRPSARTVIAIAAVALTTGCLRSAFLRIAAGSTVDNLVFTLSSDSTHLQPLASFGGIKVAKIECSSRRSGVDSAYWSVIAIGDHTIKPSPTHVRYGEEFQGYTVVTAPRTLSVGCYSAELMSPGYGGYTRFRVDTLALVHEGISTRSVVPGTKPRS